MDLDELALELWREQIARGLGEPGKVADLQGVMDWLANRTLPLADYITACNGDVAALARVRAEAGLPVFS
jgi:hypothetical protein